MHTFGACSCATGKQGHFVNIRPWCTKNLGGLFPNCSSPEHRRPPPLGKLSLGDTCPPREFFQPFRGEQPLPEHDADGSTTPEGPAH
ncbi:hypothetical protein HPB48_003292 [Haemaphysalis longicornis]|uniref:Uncharacterized protein n=1 Tax=Haemaphysalis longicornis TaxID=44386 RepID=A0A9J6GHW3_HAELO|nr:hypothetical protein HPB48_003292 [Haemaphysalis longicornis]